MEAKAFRYGYANCFQPIDENSEERCIQMAELSAKVSALEHSMRVVESPAEDYIERVRQIDRKLVQLQIAFDRLVSRVNSQEANVDLILNIIKKNFKHITASVEASRGGKLTGAPRPPQ